MSFADKKTRYLHHRMHQNLPTVAKSENVAAANDYPAGTLFLCPVEDLLALGVKLADWLAYTVRIKILRRSPVDPLNPAATFKELARSYKLTYFNDKKKMLNLFFIRFFKDPLASTIWWLQTLTMLFSVVKRLGKS